MKIRLATTLLACMPGFLALAPGGFQAAQAQIKDAEKANATVSSLYSQAQRAYLSGDTEKAAILFQQVLAAAPKHEGARNYLRMIAVERSSGASKSGALKRRLEQITLENVNFRDASLSSAIEFLRQAAEKATGGALKPNFILQLPAGYADSKFITLEVSTIPFLEALRYVCRLGGVEFVIEEHGILIEKPPQAGSAK